MLYHTVVMPEAVYNELTNNDNYEEERREIEKCTFLSVEKVRNIESVRILRVVTGLDAGESESLVLYGEMGAELLLIDEHKGRNVAKKMAVEYVGTVGILMLAFDEGIGGLFLICIRKIRKKLMIGQSPKKTSQKLHKIKEKQGMGNGL